MCWGKANLFTTTSLPEEQLLRHEDIRVTRTVKERGTWLSWFPWSLLSQQVLPILPGCSFKESMRLKNWPLRIVCVELLVRIFSERLRKHQFRTTWRGICQDVLQVMMVKIHVEQKVYLENLQRVWKHKLLKAFKHAYLNYRSSMYYSPAGALWKVFSSATCHWASSINSKLHHNILTCPTDSSSMICGRALLTSEPRCNLSEQKDPPSVITTALEISFCSHLLTFLNELNLNLQGTTALTQGTAIVKSFQRPQTSQSQVTSRGLTHFPCHQKLKRDRCLAGWVWSQHDPRSRGSEFKFHIGYRDSLKIKS